MTDDNDAGATAAAPRRPRRPQPSPKEVQNMSVDLRSRYLGLELKNPIVASASPMTSSIDSLKRLAGRRHRGRGAAFAVRGADRARGDGHAQPHAVGNRAVARSARLLPGNAKLQHRARQLSETDRRGEEEALGAGDPQPERLYARRLDANRQATGGGGRRCDRAQHLLSRHRPRRHQHRDREAVYRPGGIGQQHRFRYRSR